MTAAKHLHTPDMSVAGWLLRRKPRSIAAPTPHTYIDEHLVEQFTIITAPYTHTSTAQAIHSQRAPDRFQTLTFKHRLSFRWLNSTVHC